MTKTGRNGPCPCGSGKKYKQCCIGHELTSSNFQNPSISHLLNTALDHHQAGRIRQAEVLYQQVLRVEPRNPDALHFLGVIAYQIGKLEIADDLINRAIHEDSSNPIYHSSLGLTLQQQGNFEQAVISYRKALSLKPDFAEAHNNLGATIEKQDKLDEAVASFRKALALKPDIAEAHYNLGVALKRQGKFDEELESYRRALALKPDYPEAHLNLGNALQNQGKFSEAILSYQKALSLKPNYPEAFSNLGAVLQSQERVEEALVCCQSALLFKPDYAEAYNNLGATLKKQGRLDEAIASFRKAISLKPDYAEAYSNLANELLREGRFLDAVASYRKAISLKPDYAEACSDLGIAFQSQGQIEEAVACFEKALSIKPNYSDAHSNLLYMHASARDISPDSERRLAAQWEYTALDAAARTAARNRRFIRAPRIGRKLRVGIVSAEIGNHVVAEFLEPFLEQIDRNRLHVTLFPTVMREGVRADRIRALADDVIPLSRLCDADAAERIRSAKMDILMDTTGHTADCRLGIFAHRAAPVQITYIGYWSTTGLTEMDWFIGDKYYPAAFDDHFCEGIWKLPRVALCYRGDPSLPYGGWKPASNGTVWLGSFNRYPKIREATLELWSRVMRAIPESKLLLEDRGTDDSCTHERIVTTLAGHGIPSDRVEFAKSISGHERHMMLYDRLDIALDTIPFNSGTTACDALWMGVPLVTLEGDCVAGTIASSFLKSLGKPEWIAQSVDEYVNIVVRLARDVEGRKSLRSNQRALMASSPLCDSKDLAEALEDAFEMMFDIYQAK